MTNKKQKKLMLIPYAYRTALEGEVKAHTEHYYLVTKGTQKTFINKIEYLKMMN
jgi:hypothetical protein